MPEPLTSNGGTGSILGRCARSALLAGYVRRFTDQQDLTAQREGLLGLGVETERIYVDHGLTVTNRERPGLLEAPAAYRPGDTVVVTKLDRLARSLPDARAIAGDLTHPADQPQHWQVGRPSALPRRPSSVQHAGDGHGNPQCAQSVPSKAGPGLKKARAVTAVVALTWAFVRSRLSESNRRPIHYE
jgi:hypothetical protein